LPGNHFYTSAGRQYSHLPVKMQTVVVGGHARKIGKTSVMTGLIRGLRSFGWTAVKLTQHSHGAAGLQSVSSGAGSEEDYLLTEEQTVEGRGDTCRYLAAGARRALWLRVRQGALKKAVPALLAALRRDRFVMIESNSILSFLKPDLYLFVVDSRVRDFKPSARKFVRRADALVPLGPLEPPTRPAFDPSGFRNKPVFAVRRPDDFNPGLCRFVRGKLHLSAPSSVKVAMHS